MVPTPWNLILPNSCQVCQTKSTRFVHKRIKTYIQEDFFSIHVGEQLSLFFFQNPTNNDRNTELTNNTMRVVEINYVQVWPWPFSWQKVLYVTHRNVNAIIWAKIISKSIQAGPSYRRDNKNTSTVHYSENRPHF